MAETTVVEEFAAAIAVPDVNVLGGKVIGVGIARDEPKKLFGDTAPKRALGGKEGKSVITKAEAHLSAKLGKRSSAGAVTTADPIFNDFTAHLKVLHFLGIDFGALGDRFFFLLLRFALSGLLLLGGWLLTFLGRGRINGHDSIIAASLCNWVFLAMIVQELVRQAAFGISMDLCVGSCCGHYLILVLLLLFGITFSGGGSRS